MLVFAVIALVAVLFALASLVYLHISPTGISPVRDPVSQYGISDYRTGYRAAALSLGASALVLAVGLVETLEVPNVAGTIFLVVLGLARLTISWVPMDAPGFARTPTGLRHNLLATAFFASATVAAFLFTASFTSDPTLAGIAGISAGLAWAMAVFSALILAATLVKQLRPVFGLVERLLYAAVIAWIVTVSIALLGFTGR